MPLLDVPGDVTYGQDGSIANGTGAAGSQTANDIANNVLGGYGSGDYRVMASQSEPLVRRYSRTAVRTPGRRIAQSMIDDSGRKITVPGRTHAVVKKPGTTSVGLSAYQQEFFEKWDDPKFKAWFTSRAVASGRVSPTGSIEDFYFAWNKIGQDVASMPGWAGTPEQYLEWAASGRKLSAEQVQSAIDKGSALINPTTGRPWGEQAGAAGTEPVNPIYTTTSTSVASLNPLAANAAVSDLAKALLGRMPSKAELRRYRRAMNGILKSNPTVTTTTEDRTDPNNVTVSTRTKGGASAQDAISAVQDRVEQSSEGRAFGVGKAFEDALRMMGN